jgi:type IV pilus assembly protein PilV
MGERRPVREPRTAGFSLLEVLIAIVVLSVGIVALLSTAGGTTVMLRDGRLRTSVSALAQSRLDSLRLIALSTTPACASIASGSATYPAGMTEAWTVSGTGRTRSVTETVRVSNGAKRIGQVTVQATIFCQ